MARENAHGFLNDLSARRRTTTFFQNRQSAFAGVQENFVNTSTGALTFLVRDLVRSGGMPIVMGRIYDSKLTDGPDFGPGWKLSVIEEVRREDASFVYRDASNAHFVLNVSGSDLVPAVPAITPVVSGSTRTTGDGVGIVVLESADGTLRRFKEDGDVWRLVHVRHDRGWVRLEWRRGMLAEVTSDRGWVRIRRLADGRVGSMMDDLGRTVAYSYDAEGRLGGVTDLAGGAWTFAYSGDALASVTDPRVKVVLASSWNGNRIRRIRVLHETTDFRYAGNSTTATNLLGWSTVYRYGDSGLTESITDRMGTTTELAFDTERRPTTVTRDGVMVARLGYHADGCLKSLRRTEGNTRFTCSRRGVTVAEGAWTARYRFSERRVVESNDDAGRRAYRYADDGSLAGVTVDGLDTELRASPDGVIAEVFRNGRPMVSYAYTAGGRVSSIDYGEQRSASFSYDRRGLRTSAQYGYGDASAITATMAYDAAGNLTRHDIGETSATATEQTYRIGDYNEVLWVRTGDGGDRADLTFGYDSAGRLTSTGIGERSATVEYDALDRVTRLVVDGETLLDETYGPDDADAVARQDRRTGGVLVAAPVSPVFGTMESIVHARPRSTEFGVVAYSPSRKTFEIRLDALAPDALLLASLRARMVPLGEETPSPAPFGHDKPSNSLFLPPEFRSVNCQVCTGAVFDVYLTVTPVPAFCPTSYRAVIDGYCNKVFPGGDHVPVSFGVPLPWLHSTSFGDDASRTVTTTSIEVDGSHMYQFPNAYTMTHSVLCLCPSVFAAGGGSATFTVHGYCDRPTVDVVSANVVADKIVVRLEPTEASGTLEVALVNENDGAHTVSNSTARGGTHTISFGINSVPADAYTKVKARWTVGASTPSDTIDYSFRVLGDYTHTVYNTPNESACSGAPGAAYIATLDSHPQDGLPQCSFSSTTMKSDFIAQARLNGSGVSLEHGTVEVEDTCTDATNFPTDGSANTFRGNSSVNGSCRLGIANNSVAADFIENDYLACGDYVYIVGVGVKKVTDRCPGCGPKGLDNYSTVPACHQNLGRTVRRTVKVSSWTR